MAQVVWVARAYEHLHQIAEYIEKDSPFQARRVIQLIIKETLRLKINSRIGHIIREVNEDTYRELRIFNYRILYKILSEEQIAIIGIVHTRRLLLREMID